MDKSSESKDSQCESERDEPNDNVESAEGATADGRDAPLYECPPSGQRAEVTSRWTMTTALLGVCTNLMSCAIATDGGSEEAPEDNFEEPVVAEASERKSKMQPNSNDSVCNNYEWPFGSFDAKFNLSYDLFLEHFGSRRWGSRSFGHWAGGSGSVGREIGGWAGT